MKKFEGRKLTFFILFFLFGIVYWLKVMSLQVFNDENRVLAETNALNKITLYPFRSNVYDRNGKLLAYNLNTYNLIFFPKQMGKIDTSKLCSILEIDSIGFKKLFKKAIENSKKRKNNNQYNGSAIFYQKLNPKQLIQLQESIFEFKGFAIEPSAERYYAIQGAAHVLGYLQDADEKQLEDDAYYQPGDLVGTSGIEKYYEDDIRGVKGYRTVWQDRRYKERGLVKGKNAQQEPLPGPDFYSTLDFDLQQYGEQLLEGKRGSIVAIEPSTGEILALVNKPDFDPNALNGRDRGKVYRQMLMDPRKPLYNRAIKGQYPPGSTFKTIMAAIGMHEGILADSTKYGCGGGYRMGSIKVGCHPHGSPLDLRNSIRISCNAYYCKLYRNFLDNSKYGSVKVGYSKLSSYWRKCGLGSPLGIDIPGEKSGNVPTLETLAKRYGEQWKSSNIISMSIGQGEILLTPLQIANMACIVANRGYYYTPHIMKKLGNKTTSKEFLIKHKTGIGPSVFEVVIEGMAMVTKPGGTAGRTGIKDLEICGKTGTSQNSHGKDHSLFIAFCPPKNPKIAIAAIVENGGFGAAWAAPICNIMIEKYMHGRDSGFKTKAPQLEKKLIGVKIN